MLTCWRVVRRRDPGDIAAPGVTLSQGKQLLALIQQEVVAAQFRDHATWWPCPARPEPGGKFSGERGVAALHELQAN